MHILSIQSSVAYGHVGNSSAVFPLQRLGHEVWPVDTVQFSNHTGYGVWRGPVLDPHDVAEVIAGIADHGVLGRCDAVLSGYQGAEDVGRVILDAVSRVRELNPRAVYCCDPVMGDVGRGFYVRDGIPEFMRDHVVPASDICTPNVFELEFLAGMPVRGVADVLTAADRLRERGPRTVLVTSVLAADAGAAAAADRGRIGMVAVADDGAWQVTTPELPISVSGAGDATAALFLAHTLTDGPRTALARTAATVYEVLRLTAEGGHPEIQLIAAQDAIADPDSVAGVSDVVRLR